MLHAYHISHEKACNNNNNNKGLDFAVLSVETDPALISNFIAKNNSNNSKIGRISCKK